MTTRPPASPPPSGHRRRRDAEVVRIDGLRKRSADRGRARPRPLDPARRMLRAARARTAPARRRRCASASASPIPTRGTILLGGLPVPQRGREARIRVGVVPQMDNLDPDFTVAENLLVYGRYFGLADATHPPRASRRCSTSRASRQARRADRRAVGRHEAPADARARRSSTIPTSIFMDEPTTGLDPQARHLIWDRLKPLRARRQDDPADDALHGRGGAPRRPPRGDRPRREDRRGHAARADRRAHRAERRRGVRRRRERVGGERRRRGSPIASRSAARRCSATRTRRTTLLEHLGAQPTCATCTARRTSRTCS